MSKGKTEACRMFTRAVGPLLRFMDSEGPPKSAAPAGLTESRRTSKCRVGCQDSSVSMILISRLWCFSPGANVTTVSFMSANSSPALAVKLDLFSASFTVSFTSSASLQGPVRCSVTLATPSCSRAVKLRREKPTTSWLALASSSSSASQLTPSLARFFMSHQNSLYSSSHHVTFSCLLFSFLISSSSSSLSWKRLAAYFSSSACACSRKPRARLEKSVVWSQMASQKKMTKLKTTRTTSTSGSG
mmetsp:Transcript_49155/g.157164  ORF Transcript_49155/g.157164 Transcript_49155/m.157164 type:complete len:245 (+) Transcript_49155:1941-2675(+)